MMEKWIFCRTKMPFLPPMIFLREHAKRLLDQWLSAIGVSGCIHLTRLVYLFLQSRILTGSARVFFPCRSKSPISILIPVQEDTSNVLTSLTREEPYAMPSDHLSTPD